MPEIRLGIDHVGGNSVNFRAHGMEVRLGSTSRAIVSPFSKSAAKEQIRSSRQLGVSTLKKTSRLSNQGYAPTGPNSQRGSLLSSMPAEFVAGRYITAFVRRLPLRGQWDAFVLAQPTPTLQIACVVDEPVPFVGSFDSVFVRLVFFGLHFAIFEEGTEIPDYRRLRKILQVGGKDASND